MRSRASYRPGFNDCKTVNIVKTEKTETIVEKCEQNLNKKMKTNRKPTNGLSNCNNKTINVITIDDSEEEEIQYIETITLDLEKKSFDVKHVINRCDKCYDRLQTKHNFPYYNCLTSADFYNNLRAHPNGITDELRDRNRYNVYHKAIDQNKHLFKNKVVLIVGSGVGLLAMFAAKAGAKTVLVIESKEMVELVEEVIDRNRKNQFICDSNIIVMNGKIEDMVLPNGIQKVDIIVSDWVNHLFFYKSTIKSFIFARNKWLKKDGLIFPDSGNMYVIGSHDYIHKHIKKSSKYSSSTYVRRIDWWASNVYDFDMKAIRHQAIKEPYYQLINKSQVVTNESHLKHYNFYTLTLNDIDFNTTFQLQAIRNHYLQSFVLYFEVIFVKNINNAHMFSTRPEAPKTCFKPIVFFLDNEKELILFRNDKLTGNFSFSLTKDLNRFIVGIDFKFNNRVCNVQEKLVFGSVGE